MSTSIESIETEWFAKAANYWNQVDPTIDQMLGGFSVISDIDLKSSERFLAQFYLPKSQINKLPENKAEKVKARQIRALDCGAGIGRITKNLLLNFFEKVDLLDNCENFLKEARNYIGSEVFDQSCSVICSSLHTFRPIEDVQYDVVWIQWVSGYLPDQHFIEFMVKCKKLLKPGGFVILKENHTSTDDNDLDTNDGSVTRSYMQILKLIRESGYTLIDERRAKFAKSIKIYPVKMFCLKPDERSHLTDEKMQ